METVIKKIRLYFQLILKKIVTVKKNKKNKNIYKIQIKKIFFIFFFNTTSLQAKKLEVIHAIALASVGGFFFTMVCNTNNSIILYTL